MKVDENPADVLTVILWSSSRQRWLLLNFRPPSSWYQRTVHPTCFSQLRSPTSGCRTFQPQGLCGRNVLNMYVHKFFSCQHPPTGILQLIAMSLYNILRNMYVCMHATTQIDTGSGVYMQHIEKGCWIVPVTLLVLYGACMWVHDTSTKQHASPHKQDMVRQSLEHRADKFQMKARRLNPSISSCLLST